MYRYTHMYCLKVKYFCTCLTFDHIISLLSHKKILILHHRENMIPEGKDNLTKVMDVVISASAQPQRA